MLRRIALLTALAAPAVALANPVWTSDFESGDLADWSNVQAVSEDRVQIVSDPVRQGERALKVTVNKGDDPIRSGNDRAELLNMTYEAVGSDYYYRWSVLFPDDYPSHPKWQLFTQWHQQGLAGVPPLEMYVAGEQIRLRAGGEVDQWKGPLRRGVWQDFILHVKWSADPEQGYIELWQDGKLVLPKTPAATQLPGQLNYMKMGLYRSKEITQQGVIYFDDVVMATHLEDVLPGGGAVASSGTEVGAGGGASAPYGAGGSNPFSPNEGEYVNGGAGCSTGGVMPAALALGVLVLTAMLRRRRMAAVPVRARR